MRIVSWNMAYWKPAGFRAITNRRRQWAYLTALAPDIALLQECRPGDFDSFAPAWAQAEYAVVGAIPDRWTACSAILVRRSFAPVFVEPDDTEWFRYFSGYLARCRLAIPGVGAVDVASVHSVAKEVDDPCLDDNGHERISHGGADRAWHCDLAAAALRGWVGPRFIVGGDWNTARLFDQTYPGRWPDAGAGFFEALAGWGWCESLRRFHPEEICTYLDPKSAPYELDHLFTDGETHAGLTSCDVFDGPLVRALSDHAPIVAEVTLPDP